LFLYLSQRVPARSAVEVSARSALTKGSDRDSFCSHLRKSAVGHRSRARSAQTKQSFRAMNLGEASRDCCCRCAQSRRFNTWKLLNVCRKECVQEYSESLGRTMQGSCDWKIQEGVTSLCCRWTSFVEEHLVISQISQRKDGRTVFSEENP
jgi:hypothetical protein